MGNVVVTTHIAASLERVWSALTMPAHVVEWDGVSIVEVADDYPVVGQHARWYTRLGPIGLTLHDRITAVEPTARFAALIDVGFVHVEEEYRLSPTATGTELVTDDTVTSNLPGFHRLAVRLTRRNVTESMARLKEYCERA